MTVFEFCNPSGLKVSANELRELRRRGYRVYLEFGDGYCREIKFFASRRYEVVDIDRVLKVVWVKRC
ncbi:MAG: hypothetical protein ACXQTI_02685 [Candidatus Nezhaarchaeales archaeon]